MAQFYFLSILFNIVAGLILVYGQDLTTSKELSVSNENEDADTIKDSEEAAVNSDEKAENSEDDSKKDAKEKKDKTSGIKKILSGFAAADNKTMRLVVGVLCVFVGIMKLLSVFRNDVPVVGDLLPALAGFAGGASLLLEYYLSTTTEETHIPEIIEKIFIDSRKYIGIGCLVAGLLHFIFPQVLLL